jgi:DNA-binding response OmpR family regulator
MHAPILLVNGAPEVRSANRAVLEHAGYFVVEAVNPHHAIHLARRRHPSVIVIEPGGDLPNPVELVRRLRRHRRTCGVPIIVIGDDVTPPDSDALEELQCLTCLREPCPPERLLAEVQYARLHVPGTSGRTLPPPS